VAEVEVADIGVADIDAEIVVTDVEVAIIVVGDVHMLDFDVSLNRFTGVQTSRCC